MKHDNSTSRGTALITGASAGIGAEFARQLAADGYDLILVARRGDRLAALADELNVNVECISADLTDRQDMQRVCDRAAACDTLTMLVNNAGFGSRPLFHEMPEDQLYAMATLHMTAVVMVTRAALPGMIARRSGRVITVSSVASFFASPSDVLYCSSKTWQNAFTEGLSTELANTGVSAMALCPGFTYSEFHDVVGTGRGHIAKCLWLPADRVVREGLRASQRGKRLCIPTWRYRLIVWLTRLLPKRARLALARRRLRVKPSRSPSEGTPHG